MEVFAPDYPGQEHLTTGPVAGFAVEDVEAARAEMEALGIEFPAPTGGEPGGHRWAHFRAPDGKLYELTKRPEVVERMDIQAQVLPAHLEAFLMTHRVARLATVDGAGRPHLVPVCFAYANGAVYVALDAKPKRVPVRELRRVRNLLLNPNVQLLADRYDEDWSRLAYLQLRGVATLIESGAEHEEALRMLRERYAQYRAMPLAGAPVIRIRVESYTAWGATDGELR